MINMPVLNAVNGSLVLMCAFFCAMLFLYEYRISLFGTKKDSRLDRLMVVIIAFSIVANLADSGTWFFLEKPEGLMFKLCLMVDYTVVTLLLATMHLYIIESVNDSTNFPSFFKYIGYPISIAISLLWITSLWTGLIYTIGPLGYQYTKYHWISQLPIALIFLADSLVILCNSDKMNKKQAIVFCHYIVIGIMGELIEVNTGVAALYIALTTIVFIIHIYNSVRISVRMKEQEEIIDEEQALLHLAQIKPHFIYNCLTIIQNLCTTNPEMAQSATFRFSKFLRGYIDAMDNIQMVPLEDEIYIVDNYLYLEKLRFGNRLQMEMEIADEDFFVPSLSMEPFVENAIKYGILQKPEGGKISIRTYMTYEEHIIEIKDDGVGFDTKILEKGEADIHSHIGIKNVKSRLEKLCNGYVDIDSTIGKGTTVTIHIPTVSKVQN